METPFKLAILAIIIASFSAVSTTAATTIEEAASLSSSSTTTLLPPPPAESLPHSTADPLSATHFFAPVLTHLGFHELAMAVPSLSSSSSTAIWSEPFTVFAPSDASIHTCSSCTVHNLLQEHIVPGVFSFHYLRSLAFGTKIETIVPGRCITVTSTVNGTKIFVGGVEITRPDLFNNGLFVVHGLDGYVAHLSPISCNIERMTSLSFPPQVSDRAQSLSQYAVMRLMLSDAMLRLRITGFSILALAFKVKYAELVGLQNMTVFALDDVSIFSGGYAYVSNVRFHIVPNRLLTISDLEKLPSGTVLPTLDEGQNLVVTTAGGGLTPMRINYVRIKSANLMLNLKIVVHGLFLPFPHIHSTMMGLGGIGRSGLDAAVGTDHAAGNSGFSDVALSPEIKSRAAISIEDHHGL